MEKKEDSSMPVRTVQVGAADETAEGDAPPSYQSVPNQDPYHSDNYDPAQAIAHVLPETRSTKVAAKLAAFNTDNVQNQTRWENFKVATTIKKLTEDKCGLSKEGYMESGFIHKAAGKYSKNVRRFPVEFVLDSPEHRIARAVQMQQDGQDLHNQLHNLRSTEVNILKLIPSDEKVIDKLYTIGFEKYPGSGEAMAGDGLVVLTDKNVYFHHFGHMFYASGTENSFGSTRCPPSLCCGMRGCFACVDSCKMMWGSYQAVAQRETKTSLMIVNIEDQLMDVHSEHVMSTRLERKYTFFPAGAGFCHSCLTCYTHCCYTLCHMCYGLCDSCILNGYSHFSYDTERNRKGALEKLLIKENKTGDTSFWSPTELNQLIQGVMEQGGIDKMTDEIWFEMLMEKRQYGYLNSRTMEQCRQKYIDLMQGWTETETCRSASYRAVYIPFKDAGTRRIREAVCLVDMAKHSTEEVYSFVVHANKLKMHSSNLSARLQAEQVNSMETSGYPSRSLRDKVSGSGGALAQLFNIQFWSAFGRCGK